MNLAGPDHGRGHASVLLGASQALREIAYASGFRDYSHFARRFASVLVTHQARTLQAKAATVRLH
jgi:AraC-like DNA-binding protein